MAKNLPTLPDLDQNFGLNSFIILVKPQPALHSRFSCPYAAWRLTKKALLCNQSIATNRYIEHMTFTICSNKNALIACHRERQPWYLQQV